MRPFSTDVAEKLKSVCVGESIDWIGLGADMFQFRCGGFNVRCEHKANFSIGGTEFEWVGNPIEAPVWKLAGEKISNVISSNDVLSFMLSNGDQIQAMRNDGPYGSVILEAESSEMLEVF